MKIILTGLAVMLLNGGIARAQTMFIGQGSTPPGDYLRGAGVAAWGMGQYNVNTAQANRIDVGTEIMVDGYVRQVHAQELARNARIRAARLADHMRNYNKLRDHVLNRPEGFDILSGDALNAKMAFMNQAVNRQETFRSFPVPLPTAVVRRIPFKLGEEGIVLSMARLTHRGKGAWPIAFQDGKFDRERTEYDSAMSAALGQHLEGKVSADALKRVDRAVEALTRKLEVEVMGRDERGYQLARPHVLELGKASNLLRSSKIQAALDELESYDGSTVNDLRMFMIRHRLSFDVAERPDEREAYREIEAALTAQRDILDAQRDAAKIPDHEQGAPK